MSKRKHIDPVEKTVIEHNLDTLKFMYLNVKDQLNYEDIRWFGKSIFNLLEELHFVMMESDIDDGFLDEYFKKRDK